MTNREKVEQEIRAKMVFGENLTPLEHTYRSLIFADKLDQAEAIADMICEARSL